MSSRVKRVLGTLGVLLIAHVAPGTSYGQQVHPDARFVVQRTSPSVSFPQ